MFNVAGSKSEQCKEVLEGFVDFVESHPDNIEPSAQELDEFLSYNRLRGWHETGRNKNHIAPLLNMNMSEFEQLLIGKSILDIGCGEGRLARDIAALKKTKVTALDNDPEVLSKVPARKNIEIVEGSGFDLKEAVGDDEFDVVISSYSSFYWANNPEDIKNSLDSAISVCSIGGLVILVPVAEDPGYRSMAREYIGGAAGVDDRDMQRMIRFSNIRDWLDVVRIKTVFEAEDAESLEVVYMPGSYNGNRGKVNPQTGFPPETYSSVLEILDKS